MDIVKRIRIDPIIAYGNSKCKFCWRTCWESSNSAYISSKFALEGFSESMQYRLEEFGIKVILIEPGVVKTNLFENSKPPKKYN
jgi:NAD(P)-dependent dehydrogenase (short-subunit alcohol dehydrogenase family)